MRTDKRAEAEADAAPLSFSPSHNGLNLVETSRGLAAFSLHGYRVKPARVLRLAYTGEDMGHARLTLREALASDRLEDFVREEEARGGELTNGYSSSSFATQSAR